MRVTATSVLALLLAASLWSQAPERIENTVYTIVAFDGKDYSGTFAREGSDAIYLIANKENFLNLRRTLIYFWPITQRWQADYDTLNEEFLNGTLAVTDSTGKTQRLGPVRYTYYNFPGEYEINWKVFTGEDADNEWEKYQQVMSDYWAAVDEHNEKQREQARLFGERISEISEKRDAGEDVTELVEEVQRTADAGPGDPPQRPGYVVQPVAEAFLIDLEPGEYRIHFLFDGGEIMEGSEKRLVLHQKRREEMIGYDVIPADKWTRAETSETPSSVLYVDGTTDLYLRPFFQDEFNDLFYERTLRNDATGNPELMKWVKIQQVPKARIEMTRPNREAVIITQDPYFVEQIPGAVLGYTIVPYDPEGEHENMEPSISAYRIAMQDDSPIIRFRLTDAGGRVMPGGRRQIRVVNRSGALVLSLIFAFVPLALLAAVLLLRNRRYE